MLVSFRAGNKDLPKLPLHTFVTAGASTFWVHARHMPAESLVEEMRGRRKQR